MWKKVKKISWEILFPEEEFKGSIDNAVDMYAGSLGNLLPEGSVIDISEKYRSISHFFNMEKMKVYVANNTF